MCDITEDDLKSVDIGEVGDEDNEDTILETGRVGVKLEVQDFPSIFIFVWYHREFFAQIAEKGKNVKKQTETTVCRIFIPCE